MVHNFQIVHDAHWTEKTNLDTVFKSHMETYYFVTKYKDIKDFGGRDFARNKLFSEAHLLNKNTRNDKLL